MTTRREIITKKYLELRTAVQTIFPEDILPNLEDYDLADVVCYISFTFVGDDIETPLRQLVQSNHKGADLDESQFQQLVTIMKPFLQWFREFH